MPKTIPAAPDNSKLLERLLTLPAFRTAADGTTLSSVLAGQVGATLLTALALLVRFQIDDVLPEGFPYITFFPAVVLSGFVWGVHAAITAGVLSGLAAWYWFIAPVQSFALDLRSSVALLFYLVVIATDIGLLQLALYAFRQEWRAKEHLKQSTQLKHAVAEEIEHRLKNVFATLVGVVYLLEKHSSTSEQLGGEVRRRMTAMSESIVLLRGVAYGERISIRSSVLAALKPLALADEPRLSLDGADLGLNADAVVPLNLMLHELGTNAFKYGALSDGRGTVSIAWAVEARDGVAKFALRWTERGGPPPPPTDRSGFGTELLRRVTRSLGGECEFDFAPAGLTVGLTMDPARILDRPDAARPSAA